MCRHISTAATAPLSSGRPRGYFNAATRRGGTLLDTYSLLDLLPARDDGSKSARLARFGRYDVRLVEYGHNPSPRGRALRAELFDHDTSSVLDAKNCCDAATTQRVIAYLIARAAWLHESGSDARPSQVRLSEPTDVGG